jgi:hypothetical protein
MLLPAIFAAVCRGQEVDPADALDPRVEQLLLQDAPPQIKATPRPDVWDRFLVFVWQYRNDFIKDWELYQRIGLQAGHIDRGAGQQSRVAWAAEREMPYYVDHAAGKGVLHLTSRMGLDALRADGSLQPRPQSLITRASLDRLRQQIDDNLAVAAAGPVAAIALDDEVSLATFNSPYEVDASPASVRLYRRWLAERYGSLSALNAQWESSYSDWDQIEPINFEAVRTTIHGQPFSRWNLSRWIDWRSYMDSQFTAAIATLVEFAGQQAPGVPVGIVGGQSPSAFGGYDYSKFTGAVQWIESYDIGGTNELLGSLWHESRKPIVQTFFASGDATRDAWFLWYYWAHGNSAVIAWPDSRGKPWFDAGQIRPDIEQLEDTFRELQSLELAPLSQPTARLRREPVALLYSHASVQASWATDALTHGKTWPRRSSSLDNKCSSSAKNRIAWNKLLEDCGVQARWVTEAEVAAGTLREEGIRLLILPRALALAEPTCVAIEQFAQQGGYVVADYWAALLDEHGRGRSVEDRLVGRLDRLFGVRRDESAGYFDGQTMTEIDGEKYRRPLLERLSGEVTPATPPSAIERGTEAVDPSPRTRYLNRSPVAYVDASYRAGAAGEAWRKAVRRILDDAGIEPPVVARLNGRPEPAVEVLRWEIEDQLWIVAVANPTREALIDGAGASSALPPAGTLELKFRQPHNGAVDVRTGQTFPAGERLEVPFRPDAATVLRLQ